MGLAKKGTSNSAVTQEQIPAVQSGTEAAVERLMKTKPEPINKGVFKGRDFDAEARGKTRCATFNAALMSPALAGLKFKDIDGFLELVRKAADAGVKYSFND